MTQIDNSNYDWERCFSYRGNSGDMHYVYRLWYVPAGRSDSHNQYGYYAPIESLFYVNLTPRYDPEKTFRWTDKDTEIKYKINYGWTSSYIFNWARLATMSISEIYMNDKAYPNDTEYITTDINNSGGDGVYDIILLDGNIELDKESDVFIPANGAERSTLTYTMLPQDMTLTLRLIDKDGNASVDEETRTVKTPTLCDDVVCEPTCFGTDLWSTKCVDGECVQGNLLDENNVFNCGYTEDKMITYEEVCIGAHLFKNKYEDGVWVGKELIEIDSSVCSIDPVDPCDDVPPDPAPGMAWEYIAVGVTVIVFIYYMRR